MTLRRLIFLRILEPLILRNYRLRAEGKVSGEWYWPDRLALSWGFDAGPYGRKYGEPEPPR